MKKQFKLGIIGCGFMANAILNGIIERDFLRAKKIIISDTDKKKLDDAFEKSGVNVTEDNRYLVDNSEFVLLAVKPQNFRDVVKNLDGVCPEKIISIMAGVKRQSIKNAFGEQTIKVARSMPNLPCSVGCGMVGVDMSDYNDDTDDIEFINNLFACLGEVLSTDEAKLDAVTGISGSGPAYTFFFIDSLVQAGIKQGLSADEAKLLALQTVLGSAAMAMQSDKELPDLIAGVCSKGGTTIEAINVFEEKDMRSTIAQAVAACVKRSEELSNQ